MEAAKKNQIYAFPNVSNTNLNNHLLPDSSGPAEVKNRLQPSDGCPANGENCKDDNNDEDNNMKT